jgi:serine kinase of HPr protein (carbohydrate metabolism regulator)
MSEPLTVHGSAVLLGETGILIRGASASGKSALVLELLAADPERARLVADDRVILAAVNGRLLAGVPAAIAGLIELRGVGLLRRPFVAPVVIRLVVDLVPAGAAPRLPERAEAETAVEGIVLPRLALAVGGAGAALTVRAALAGPPAIRG